MVAADTCVPLSAKTMVVGPTATTSPVESINALYKSPSEALKNLICATCELVSPAAEAPTKILPLDAPAVVPSYGPVQPVIVSVLPVVQVTALLAENISE